VFLLIRLMFPYEIDVVCQLNLCHQIEVSSLAAILVSPIEEAGPDSFCERRGIKIEGNSRNIHQLLRRGWQIPCSLSPCSCFNILFFYVSGPSTGASLDLEKHGMNFSSLSLLPSPASSNSSLILVRWGSGSLIHEHARCIHPTKTSCD